MVPQEILVFVFFCATQCSASAPAVLFQNPDGTVQDPFSSYASPTSSPYTQTPNSYGSMQPGRPGMPSQYPPTGANGRMEGGRWNNGMGTPNDINRQRMSSGLGQQPPQPNPYSYDPSFSQSQPGDPGMYQRPGMGMNNNSGYGFGSSYPQNQDIYSSNVGPGSGTNFGYGSQPFPASTDFSSQRPFNTARPDNRYPNGIPPIGSQGQIPGGPMGSQGQIPGGPMGSQGQIPGGLMGLQGQIPGGRFGNGRNPRNRPGSLVMSRSVSQDEDDIIEDS